MFDLATRSQPASHDAAAVFGVPFDLRLVTPLAPTDYPYTSFVNATGAPQPGIEVLATWAVELEDTLQTAVILSLFTDRRAGPDDVLPRRATDRRGWVGEEFFGTGLRAGDAWGSALWLVHTGKAVPAMLEQARFAAQEALAWMVRDGIASRIEVSTSWVGARADRLAVRPSIYQPQQTSPVYDVLWGTSITRHAA